MAHYIEGHLQGAGRKIGIVVARFNSFISEKLLEGAIDTLVVPASTVTTSWLHGCREPLKFLWRPRKWRVPASMRRLSALAR